MNSEKIKSLLKDWRITIAVGVVVGILLGLLVGWGIWPVQWTDLAPYHLRPDLREDYLRMSIFTTAMTGDTNVATKAWSELEDTAEETLDAVRANPGYLTPEQITSFVAIVGGAGGGQVVPTTGIEIHANYRRRYRRWRSELVIVRWLLRRPTDRRGHRNLFLCHSSPSDEPRRRTRNSPIHGASNARK